MGNKGIKDRKVTFIQVGQRKNKGRKAFCKNYKNKGSLFFFNLK